MKGKFDHNEWRPITFEGTTFPPTLMGISVLGSILPEEDDELEDWLRAIRHCSGVTKRATAEQCRACADRAMHRMTEHREAVLAGIEERLGPHGFDATTTFRDWMDALRRIAEIAGGSRSACEWSAPGYASDPLGTPEKRQRFLDSLLGKKPDE
jgi:hypothetical protein